MVNGRKQPGKSEPGSSSSKRASEVIGNASDGTHGQAAKRSRVSRACDQCRASREKCDGSQPECETCRAQQRDCSYNEQPKKRGIQPNYIRTLELAMAWIFQSFPVVATRLTSALPASDSTAHRLIGSKDADATETLHAAWRDGLVSKQIEQLLSGGPIDTADHDITGTANTHVNGNLPDNLVVFADSAGSGELILDHVNTTEPSGSVADGRKCYQLPDNSWTLLEYYFAFTNAWLPMADRSSILKTAYLYPSTGLALASITAAEHAELWAIMALASIQTCYGRPRGDVQWIVKLVEGLLPTGNTSFELPHIRALIILAVIDMQDDHMLAAWLKIGTVARLLYMFKLLQSLGQFTKWCRHIHLAAFVLESALALHLGTPGHLTPEYVNSIGYVDEDGMEEWTPWQDPLRGLQTDMRAPTRSFSTINDLVRKHVGLVKQATVQPEFGMTQQGAASSVVFSLIRNATLQNDRLQPSVLLSTHTATLSDALANNRARADPIADPPFVGDSQHVHGEAVPAVHPFMSIPSEPTNFGLENDVATVLPSSSNYNAGVPADNLAQPISPEMMYEPNTDIFEELANLERQDSMQQPQFLQNLGFGPDLDLAEFFGEDYQQSDPFLAYLYPSNYDISQSAAKSGINT